MKASTLQSLKHQNAKMIQKLERDQALYKCLVKVKYDYSDPNTVEGRESFEKLNQYRDTLRDITVKLKKARVVQCDIKGRLSSLNNPEGFAFRGEIYV